MRYFTESHNMLPESVRKFITRETTPYVDEWEKEESFPRELYRKSGDAGFLSLGYPEELAARR